MPTRRALLRAGGVALTAGLAGCECCPPLQYTRVALAVQEPFAADSPPYEVPLGVDVTLHNPDTEAVAVEGIAVHALDPDGEVAGTARLGTATYRDADADRRTEERYGEDSACDTATVYHATVEREAVLSASRFPDRIAVGVEDVRFQPETDADAGLAGPVGVAGAACANRPALTATVLRYCGERPPPDTVDPSAYDRKEARRYRRDAFEGEPLVPRGQTVTPSPTGNATAGNATRTNGTATGGVGPNGTLPGTAVSNGTATDSGAPNGTDGGRSPTDAADGD